MLKPDAPVKVYLARGTTDLRKSFNSLAGLVRETLECDPLSGDFFVFCGRQRTLIKILYWDGTGFWVLTKRLARGTFPWPDAKDSRTTIDLRPDELDDLLGGIDLRRATWRRWWRQPTTPLPAPPPLAV